ncbi:MAG: DUF4199 domain-containing protein [Bacteroidales bacterium]|nr:DUF4199 domain-containing protein [Bacteroidales bacterium]
MEQKSISVFGAGLMPGILIGFALIVFQLIMYLLDVPSESYVNYLAFVVLAAGLFWSIIQFRDNRLDGFISYGKAVGSGFAVGLIASVLIGVFMYFYVTYMNTGLVEQVLITAEENMLEQNPNMTDEQIEQAMSMVEIFTTPTMMAVMSFVYNVVVSVIFSLIIAIFAKREDRSIA